MEKKYELGEDMLKNIFNIEAKEHITALILDYLIEKFNCTGGKEELVYKIEVSKEITYADVFALIPQLLSLMQDANSVTVNKLKEDEEVVKFYEAKIKEHNKQLEDERIKSEQEYLAKVEAITSQNAELLKKVNPHVG